MLSLFLLSGQANFSDTKSSPLLDVWFPLWPTLWQSAIGLLMAGALVSVDFL